MDDSKTEFQTEVKRVEELPVQVAKPIAGDITKFYNKIPGELKMVETEAMNFFQRYWYYIALSTFFAGWAVAGYIYH